MCLLQLFLLLEHICGPYTSSNIRGSAATTSPVRPAGRRHLWLIVPLSSHQQLFGRWSVLHCDRERCLCLSGESVISPICSSSLFPSTWKTPQDDGTKRSRHRSVVWKWVSVFVVFWILNTDFCFCVTSFEHVRSTCHEDEKQIIESVVPEVSRLYFLSFHRQTALKPEESQDCSFTCFRLIPALSMLSVCIKIKIYFITFVSFFIVLIVSWVTPETNQEPMALLVCAVWKQVVKNNVFVSQLTFTFHPLTLTPLWCHHAARVVWCGGTLQTLISRETSDLSSAAGPELEVLRRCVQTHKQNLNSGPFNEFDSKRIWTLFINWK